MLGFYPIGARPISTRYDFTTGSAAGSFPAPTGTAYLGATAEGDFPAPAGFAAVSDPLVFARGTFPVPTLGDVVLGVIALGAFPAATTSAQASNEIEIATAGGTFPMPQTAFIYASGTFPMPRGDAVTSAVESLTKQAWVTNLNLAETTRFMNFDFIQLIRVGNTIYGVKSDGIYALGAATDAGSNIAAQFDTHPNDFGTTEHKRIQFAYLGNSPADVTVIPTVDGSAIGAYMSDVGKRRVKMALGAKGRYWSLSIRNVSGGDLKIDGLEPLIIPLSRKV